MSYSAPANSPLSAVDSSAQLQPEEPAVKYDFEDPAYRVFIDTLGYLPPEEIALVCAAYRFSDEAHQGQTRLSGEPYITHPLAVAGALAEWRMDVQAIVAALLHDVMEDTAVTKAQIAERFGKQVADLVDGLSKLDKIEFQSYQDAQAENFRKMLMAMARDLRIVLIKLADRRHNLQTMAPIRPERSASASPTKRWKSTRPSPRALVSTTSPASSRISPSSISIRCASGC